MIRILIVLSLLFTPSLLLAQQNPSAAKAATTLPNLQKTNAPAAPEVSLCTAADVKGIWKLRDVIETPEGAIKKQQADIPHQYMYFEKNGLYYNYKAPKLFRRRDGLLKSMTEAQKDGVKQYVVGEKGAVFYYVNSKPTETWYCGKIKKTLDPYIQGDLLFTPAKKTEGYSLYTSWKRPGFATSHYKQPKHKANPKPKPKK